MSGFLFAPVFLPYQQPLDNGADGDVLTIVGGSRAWAPASGGSVKQGYLGSYIEEALGAGTYTDHAPAGFDPGVGRYDVVTTGTVILAGLVTTSDGQMLNIRNFGTGVLELASPGFQFPGTIVLPTQYDAQLVCYYGGSINAWCMA